MTTVRRKTRGVACDVDRLDVTLYNINVPRSSRSFGPVAAYPGNFFGSVGGCSGNFHFKL